MNKIIITLCFSISTSAFSAWKVKRTYHRISKKSQVISIEKTSMKIQGKRILLKEIPAFIAEKTPFDSNLLYQELLLRSDQLQERDIPLFNARINQGITKYGSEVQTLVKQGPDDNRIVLTILGDGYTLSEKNKFFSDAKRMTKDLFGEKTFNSYLSLFNIYAVFVPSQESGITDIEKKNTAFGLYRSPKGSKRAVMPGKTWEIEKALRLAPAPADYPIIIANDDFYGGLGGRYAITTRSHNSGSMVLRHELGHNFGNVGEEYDGGQVYSGANFSRTTNVPWKHWLENSHVTPYKAEFLGGDYIWQPLKNNSYKKTYQFPHGNYHLVLNASSVGWESLEDVTVRVNGRVLTPKGIFTKDRSFFEYVIPHFQDDYVQIEVFDSNFDGNDLLAFMNAYAYPTDYNNSRGVIEAFANYNYRGRFVGYRPTHSTCLMKDMRSLDFCKVDQENMWHEFLKRISLIDDVQVHQGTGQAKITTPSLERMQIMWLDAHGRELPQTRNKKEIRLPQKGEYTVKVRFITPEVRKYNSHFEAKETLRF